MNYININNIKNIKIYLREQTGIKDFIAGIVILKTVVQNDD